MLDGAFKVKLVSVEAPEDGMLPFPVHPVHTCRVLLLLVSEKGETTDSVMVVPASTHLLGGSGLPYEEVTVRENSCLHTAVTLMGPSIGIEIGFVVFELSESVCVHPIQSYFSPDELLGGVAVIFTVELMLHQCSPGIGSVLPKFVCSIIRY